MYKHVQNSVVKISMMFPKYFEYYTIILREPFFLWTRCRCQTHCSRMATRSGRNVMDIEVIKKNNNYHAQSESSIFRPAAVCRWAQK